jgi:hypothetical protein
MIETKNTLLHSDLQFIRNRTLFFLIVPQRRLLLEGWLHWWSKQLRCMAITLIHEVIITLAILNVVFGMISVLNRIRPPWLR